MFSDLPVQGFCGHDASRRLANEWLRTPRDDAQAELRYIRSHWKSFRHLYVSLELTYVCAVARVASRLNCPTLPKQHRQSSKLYSIGAAAMTLWRMAWEGVIHPAYLDQHDHPAFGIATWLALQAPCKPTILVHRRELRSNFDTALELSLAQAIALARFMHSHGIYLFDQRLLRPAILDSAHSPTLANKTVVTI